MEADDDTGFTNKPYHPKRPHRKSRTGCRQCKVRKVKCDEGRPSCRNCTLRKEFCIYSSTARSSPSPGQPPESLELVLSERSSRPQASARSVVQLSDEPLYTAPGRDGIDMKLLWFYTTRAYESFAVDDGQQPQHARHEILKVTVVQRAFEQPFLMNSLLGLAALNMDCFNLDEEIARPRSIIYRAKAFEGYRKAIEKADPASYPALLASSLFLCALSSQVFREADAPPFYILDWMVVWTGIGLIVDLIKREGVIQSGMARLFVRPAIDLEVAATHIPSHLLFMITSIPSDDDEAASVPAYYETLKFLGSLYQELELGFSPILELRIVTFFTFMCPPFVAAARQKRPRALVIIAHYCVFAKLVSHVWWMGGIGNRDIRDIIHLLGDDWGSELRVPRLALDLLDRRAIGQLLLDNHVWEPPGDDFFGDRRSDPRLAQLSLVDDSGKELALPGNFAYRPLDVAASSSSDDTVHTPSSGSSSTPGAQYTYLAAVEDIGRFSEDDG